MKLTHPYYRANIHTLGGQYRFKHHSFINRRLISGDIWLYQAIKTAL